MRNGLSAPKGISAEGAEQGQRAGELEKTKQTCFCHLCKLMLDRWRAKDFGDRKGDTKSRCSASS
ncbi:uncharacterized protein Dana_GF27517 [Drosophila ananassae]|uniref:Uncharacterized protein n=1 Tax=Drosophila ananassae TaxID=7217 RepID=A0A0P8XUR6_DROAN|nr:uncharacterized protein Dana_GF27517 [Drosophila ananassae]